MQRVRLKVVRDRRLRSVDGVRIYSDGGSGEMDLTRPIHSRRLLMGDDVLPQAGHLMAGHLMSAHLDRVRIEGHLQGWHLLDAHLRPTGGIVYETDPLVFGRFQFGVVIEDELGHQGAMAVQSVVVNSDPAVVMDLVTVEQNPQTLGMIFAFTPGGKLAG